MRDFFHIGRVNGTIEEERILWKEGQLHQERKKRFLHSRREEKDQREEPFLRGLPSLWRERRKGDFLGDDRMEKYFFCHHRIEKRSIFLIIGWAGRFDFFWKAAQGLEGRR